MEMAITNFDRDALETWARILEAHSKTRDQQIVDIFLNGVEYLGFSPKKIPNLDEVNRKLKSRGGFRGVFVAGLEDGKSFFSMLANREFPIGNFIRSKSDLSYTPEPDIVHDLYGHMPFYADVEYSAFCEKFGQAASRFFDRSDLLRQFERFFWFTAEFGLVKTTSGLRIFGAGIASSIGECAYALSGKPELIPFSVDAVRNQEFRIDQMQTKLFLLESPQQLYASLDEFVRKVEEDK